MKMEMFGKRGNMKMEKRTVFGYTIGQMGTNIFVLLTAMENR